MTKQGSCLEKEIRQGTMPGARRRGRPHTAWMVNIKTWTGIPLEESTRMTEDRDKWRKATQRQLRLLSHRRNYLYKCYSNGWPLLLLPAIRHHNNHYLNIWIMKTDINDHSLHFQPCVHHISMSHSLTCIIYILSYDQLWAASLIGRNAITWRWSLSNDQRVTVDRVSL